MSKEVGMSRKNRGKGGTPAGTKGARRATGESAGGGLAPGQRWSAGRKREVVLRVLRGESLDALSRELGVEIYRLEEWRDKALSGLDAGLKDRQDDPLGRELDAAKRHIGELSMEIELLRTRSRAAEAKLPLATRRSRR
jgi:transposase